MLPLGLKEPGPRQTLALQRFPCHSRSRWWRDGCSPAQGHGPLMLRSGIDDSISTSVDYAVAVPLLIVGGLLTLAGQGGMSKPE